MRLLAGEAPGEIARALALQRRLVEIGIGSQILRDLGVKEMTLLTNQPQSRYIGLEGYGLKIVGTKRIE